MRGYAAVGIINSKTEANVGGALRACSCYGASMVCVEGCRYQRSCQDTTAMYRSIPLIHTDNIWSVIPFDCIPIAIEINKSAKSIVSFTHPERAFYIFGPEDGSIPNRIMDKCKMTVMIPTKYCMNLAATVNVVLYDRLSKGEK